MKYLLETNVKYKIDTVDEVEKLHEEMKKSPDYTLTEFSYKTKYVKEKGDIIGEYQIVSAKLVLNDEKEPENGLIDIYFSNGTDEEGDICEF